MSGNDKSDPEVTERRDVTDLSTNDEVEEAVDDMLGIPEEERPERNLSVPEGEEDLEAEADEPELRPEVEAHMEAAREQQEAQESESSTEVTVSSLDEPDEWESFDFEDQEWTLDDAKEPEIREIRGMVFKLAEPEDDDEILNQLEVASDGDRWDQMFALVSLVVEGPEVTEERWDNMSFASKLALGSAAADYLGLDEGFLDE